MSEEELFSRVDGSDDDPLLLLLDSVQDPHNLGACLRSAEGAGVLAVVTAKDRTSPLTETVSRVACGAAERVPLVRVVNLARFMISLKELGFWLVGTTDKADKSIYSLDLTGRMALVMGSEGTGLRRLTAEKCDFLAQIPMQGDLSSLNLSVATGVCLFEAVRQRKAGNS